MVNFMRIFPHPKKELKKVTWTRKFEKYIFQSLLGGTSAF